MSKIIRDPIYGYIEIDDPFVSIINSASFQRLRNIIQTSYSSIFPSSIHNRFSHSLGVYHLGKLSFRSLMGHYKKAEKEQLSSFETPFLFACLCHDIGHAPFSHTGEFFYDSSKITDLLNEVVSDSRYEDDLNKKPGSGGIVGAQHEIMSALISLKVFPHVVDKKDYDFVSRCIIGLKYDSETPLDIFKNSCIELLNSKIIDVDKLDYVVRDSYMSGFCSTSIDYSRLVESIRPSESKEISICFSKHSLSVLENVISAHDLEVRWIQSHPSICYESFLIQLIIKRIISAKGYGNLLSVDSLLEKGIVINKRTYRLLSDPDIISLAKQHYEKSEAIREFFNRSIRKKPLWKSESEFKALFGDYDFNKLSFFEIIDSMLSDMVIDKSNSCSINDEYLRYLISEKEKLTKKITKNPNKMNIIKKKELVDNKIAFVGGMRDYLLKNNQKFDFMILSKTQFARNLFKPYFKNVEILFENIPAKKKISEISDIDYLKDHKKKSQNYFYFYYSRNEENAINRSDFSREFISLIENCLK